MPAAGPANAAAKQVPSESKCTGSGEAVQRRHVEMPGKCADAHGTLEQHPDDFGEIALRGEHQRRGSAQILYVHKGAGIDQRLDERLTIL